MSVKSIAAAVQISSHDEDGRRVADALSAVFSDGEEAAYAPDGFVDIIGDAWWHGSDIYEDGVPVICLCNCMYDLCLSWESLSRFRLVPVARTSSEIFSISVYDGKKLQCIIFDLRHLMPRGMSGMAEATGMERDGTSMGDCRIMMAYASKVSREHHLTKFDFDGFRHSGGTKLGSKVMTLTSLARDEIDEEIGQLSYKRKKGRKEVDRTLRQDYLLDARMEAPTSYYSYAVRRACMRGGFTFNSARESNRVLGTTLSIDETSAHHAHAIGHFVPEVFKQRGADWLQAAAERVVAMPTEAILRGYAVPFIVAMHVQVEFHGLRLRPGSVFEQQEIGLEATARLAASSGVAGVDTPSAVEAERAIRERGYGDKAVGASVAFGKVMAADVLTTWVTEIELWCMAQVYTWDEMVVVQGEAATKRKRPDDYAILTSMHFWAAKQDLKRQIRETEDDMERQRLKIRYDGEVKPQFNAVGYGLHARDEYRPSWSIDESGKWHLQDPISPEDFEERRPERPRAWFNYGMRISGWSRLHLVVAMQLLHERFGDRIRIVAGDTDSLKICTDIPSEEIVEALSPLHSAMRSAIDLVTSRAREMWPDYYDDMTGVGEFVPEGTYAHFYTPNLKEYASIDDDGRLELTCAGVPDGGERGHMWSFQAWLQRMVEAYSPKILERAFAFDITLSPEVSQLATLTYGTEDPSVSALPKLERLAYTLNSLDDADARGTVAWQRRHGRDIYVDCNARCTWRGGRAVFVYRYGEIDA